MVTYPPWFSAFDRRHIDQALAEQLAPVVTTESPTLVIFRREYASAAAAAQAVLAVFEVIVS